MSEPTRQAEPTEPGQHTRAMLHSLVAEPTAFLTFSPEHIEKLRGIAPQGRRRTLPYVAALVVLAMVVVVGVVSGAPKLILTMLHPAPVAEAPRPGTPPVEAAKSTSGGEGIALAPEAPAPPRAATLAASAPLAQEPSASAPDPSTALDSTPARPSAASTQRTSHTPRKPHRRAPH